MNHLFSLSQSLRCPVYVDANGAYYVGVKTRGGQRLLEVYAPYNETMGFHGLVDTVSDNNNLSDLEDKPTAWAHFVEDLAIEQDYGSTWLSYEETEALVIPTLRGYDLGISTVM